MRVSEAHIVRDGKRTHVRARYENTGPALQIVSAFSVLKYMDAKTACFFSNAVYGSKKLTSMEANQAGFRNQLEVLARQEQEK